jgi:pSer/pThr/pTyr-binding forkhead associated (FHA) protein
MSMPGLASFERMLESLVERSMIAPLRGKLQPIEIAKRLERCMRDHALTSIDAQIAPNVYRVQMNPADLAGLAPARELIEGELARHVAQRGSAQGYVFLAAPTVELLELATARRGSVQIEGQIKEPPRAPPRTAAGPSPSAASPAPSARRTPDPPPTDAVWQLDFGSWRAPLPDRPLRVGRALECDVVIPSPRVSRHHAELIPVPDGLQVRDLGSTNGTTVDGARATDSTVAGSGARIAFGGIEARLQPATQTGAPPPEG